jgi:hypothetical protein
MFLFLSVFPYLCGYQLYRYMKTHAALYLAIFAFLSLQSCGVMPLSADQGQRVQTKFFGANFGDKGEYAVKDKMVHNGIGYRWSFVEKGTWGMQNVSFAGNNWETALVRFTEQNFSSISFADSFSSEEEALEKLDELRELLGKKYNLQRKVDSNRATCVLLQRLYRQFGLRCGCETELEQYGSLVLWHNIFLVQGFADCRRESIE